eukprot:5090920-Pleurochrysis_carterae.AAC.2
MSTKVARHTLPCTPWPRLLQGGASAPGARAFRSQQRRACASAETSETGLRRSPKIDRKRIGALA